MRGNFDTPDPPKYLRASQLDGFQRSLVVTLRHLINGDVIAHADTLTTWTKGKRPRRPWFKSNPWDIGRDALFARDNLVRDFGVRLFYTLSLLAPCAPPKDTPIPARFPVTLPANAPAEGPSYFLGVFAPNSTKVTLHPAHHDVLAVHCPRLPSTIQASPPASEIPAHPLCLPDPQSYALLSQYMYTHRQDLLLASLLPPGSLPSNPFPTTAHLSSSPKTAEEIHSQLLVVAESLAKDFTQHKLLGGLSTVHGLWKNTVALGVDDDGLWEVIHAAWGVYLTAAGWTDSRLHLRKGELIPGYQ
ncbi:hypothetical protein ARMGADRAFT_1171672 [Armillaria gallica]|uniref:Uncharacterized protein n=1 Tax=Armillaria gallica TaxID=47427 RepID=A0A2H3CG95_ARMGA|nr:hypothetical protein ARMGADRAFT_1171672 [Armillaria gallica]